ncbi:hypothetical protein ZHAS_00014734 [Anopheles sinensis]|uniref:Uncharacterized protein n=1 Tax=Anopheles sinensis TaxID=74873 RepID=A0A084W938_ANOSI|nr:hypothetical protein ZHAS_00014734 [Anopheles sinensis]
MADGSTNGKVHHQRMQQQSSEDNYSLEMRRLPPYPAHFHDTDSTIILTDDSNPLRISWDGGTIGVKFKTGPLRGSFQRT